MALRNIMHYQTDDVLRKKSRKVEKLKQAMDEHGQPIELEGSGLLARAFCHEIDHLDGILFIDKVIPGSIINQNEVEPEEIKK